MTDLKPGSRWLLPVTYEKPGINSHFFLTDTGYHVLFDQPEISTLIPADRITELEAEVARQREALAAWMIKNSYATGHGDALDDLIAELDWQHAKRNTTNAHDQ